MGTQLLIVEDDVRIRAVLRRSATPDVDPVVVVGELRIHPGARDARLGDVVTFAAAHGLSWKSGRGMRTETDLRPYTGKRGQIGHTVPRGFPASGRFAG